MKKTVCYALIAALALSLCACANSDKTISDADTEGGTPFVEVLDPFLETESGGTDSEEDDGYYKDLREMNPDVFNDDWLDHEKHYSSSTSFGGMLVKANGEIYGEGAIPYRGEEMELSFTATAHTRASDHSTGFRVFIGGTPQILSLNGSEPSTLVILEGKNDETKECSIRFTPRLTKENIANKDDLELTLVSINNPLYLTSGTMADVDFKQPIGSFGQFPFKLEGDCETIELVSGKSFEHFANRDSEVSKYFWMSVSQIEGKSDESGIQSGVPVLFELYSTTKEKPVIRDGKADITLLLYAGTPTTPIPYKVYFYVNHEPVKIDGCDYITAELKYGFAAKYTMTVDNLKAGDIVYAIAIAENIGSDEGLSRDEWAMKTDTRRLFAAD